MTKKMTKRAVRKLVIYLLARTLFLSFISVVLLLRPDVLNGGPVTAMIPAAAGVLMLVFDMIGLLRAFINDSR